MQLKICDVNILKEFFASFKDFLPVAFKPGAGKPTEDPAVLTKNLVSAMWVLIIAHALNIVYFVVLGSSGPGIVQGITRFITNSIIALVLHWITWFAYVKREPNCFYFCIVCIEDWQPQQLVWGVLMLLWGGLQAVQSLLNMLDALKILASTPIAAIFSFISSGILCVYGILMVLVAVSLIKIGGKKAGIEIPDPAAAVGKTEEANPAESA